MATREATREAKRNKRGMALYEGCGATRERQHDNSVGGAPNKVVRRRCNVLLHNNQPCLDAFLAEWGVMRGGKRGNKRSEARQERDAVT